MDHIYHPKPIYFQNPCKYTSRDIHVYIRHAVEIKPCAQIQALVVACTARRQGAAKLLVGAAEEWARAEGLQWLSLYCSSYRDVAHDFYRAQGFDAVKTATQFRKKLY